MVNVQVRALHAKPIMASALLICLAISSSASAAAAGEFASLVNYVNSAGVGWTAGVPTRFAKVADARALCKALPHDHPDVPRVSSREHSTAAAASADLPAAFDARDAFPQCPLIGRVRDQSNCGGCWSFAATETFEGRRCVHTNVSVSYSELDTLTCCIPGQDCYSRGCEGGHPNSALVWMSKRGVVTGGDYGETATCKPYAFPPCAHEGAAEDLGYQPCAPGPVDTPACVAECGEGYPRSYAADKAAGGNVTAVNGVESVKQALLRGPLSSVMTVYEDLLTYTGGVYSHVAGDALGRHAVTLIGWGTQGGVDYWLAKNSWNVGWGDKGFFKIAVGECGVDYYPTSIDW